MVARSSSTSLLPLVLLSLVLGAPALATVGNPATPEVAATPLVGAQAAVPVVNTGATANANLASIPGSSACPAMAAFIPGGISIQRKDYSMAREMTIFDPWGNTSLGSISSPIYTYASENELRTVSGSLVAKLVNPTVFWDTTAHLYDCVNDQFAKIQWSTSSWGIDIFNPSKRVFDIFDASGTKVAIMETITTGTGTVHRRSEIQLKVGDTMVVKLDMTHYGLTKSVFGLFGHFEKATISFIASPTIAVPPLLKDPRFLSLIAAEAFAPGNNGPFVTVLFWALPLACIFCCCCQRCLCHQKKSKDGRTINPSEIIANANNEDRTRLMGPGEAGMREAQHNAGKYPPQQQGVAANFFSGCCRRQQPPMGHGIAPV